MAMLGVFDAEEAGIAIPGMELMSMPPMSSSADLPGGIGSARNVWCHIALAVCRC